MAIAQLLEPILGSESRHINFFEGRLLTARDLREEQAANHLHDAQLGRAIGAGVVEGLFVTVDSDGSGGTAPVLSVAGGLAINPNGRTLWLPSPQKVSLTRSQAEAGPDAKLFADCPAPSSTAGVPNGTGFYVFVISPASGFQERAPTSGLGSNGKVTGCGDRYAVEGVQFRLVQLQTNLSVGSGLAGTSKLRNELAHLAFGTKELADAAISPFQPDGTLTDFTNTGIASKLLQSGSLSRCDVPLALLHWTASGISFLDTWSVRRRPAPKPQSSHWPSLVEQKRTANAEAVLMQFHEHITWLLTKSQNPSAIALADYFSELPPAGLVPLASSASAGFHLETFFGGPRKLRVIDHSQVGSLLRESLDYAPMRVDFKSPIRLYQCRQNLASTMTSNPLRPFVLFASPHMMVVESARFDVAVFDVDRFV